jgi:hypothetical protein
MSIREPIGFGRWQGERGAQRLIVYAKDIREAWAKLRPMGCTGVSPLPPLEDEAHGPEIDIGPGSKEVKYADQG